MTLKIMSILVTVGILCWIDIPVIMKKASKTKDLAIFISLMITATLLSLAIAVKLPIPSPLQLFDQLVRPLNNLIANIQ